MKKVVLLIIFVAIFNIVKANDSTKMVVHFLFNKHHLHTTTTQTLDSFLNTINTQHKIVKKIIINGHTDQIGNHIYNQHLSLLRANSVANYFIKKNIDSSTIHTVAGFGKKKLLTSSYKKQDRLLNRRVEIIFYFVKIIKEFTTQKIDTATTIDVPKHIITKSKKIKEIINDTTVKIGNTIALPYILFIGGMHQFLNISYPYLDELFFALKENPNLQIEIQGHICCAPNKDDAIDIGTGKNNLSVARAKAVYNFLVQSGIDASRLSYKGFGHQFPLTQEKTPEEQTRNRRVEIKILNK